jgi:hypothetical protein
MKKAQGSDWPGDLKELVKTVLHNQIKLEAFNSFIERSYKGELTGYYSTAAGFIENDIKTWLKKNANIEMGESITIALESRLLGKGGPKGIRHGHDGTGIGNLGGQTIIEALLYGNVYFDKGNLIFLFPHSASRMSKITVNPKAPRGGSGSTIIGPVIVNIESIPAVKGEGEFRRVTEGLVKIK